MAISLSGLCLIHCLVLPILSVSLPIAGVWADIEWLHKAFVVAAFPFSLIRLTSPVANASMTALIVSGLWLLAGGAFVEQLHELETPLTVLGGMLLAAGHVLGWRRAHSH
ncbi:MAG: MerC domain-containing protein [Pseudomonadota bacterium]|nr:MerC domain-containing protein [Pseudomonadota bacterium]